MPNFKTTKAFNKWCKRFPLYSDNDSKRLYPFDFVRLTMPTETRNSWCSRIHFSYLNGAWVDANPGHRKITTNNYTISI